MIIRDALNGFNRPQWRPVTGSSRVVLPEGPVLPEGQRESSHQMKECLPTHHRLHSGGASPLGSESYRGMAEPAKQGKLALQWVVTGRGAGKVLLLVATRRGPPIEGRCGERAETRAAPQRTHNLHFLPRGMPFPPPGRK